MFFKKMDSRFRRFTLKKTFAVLLILNIIFFSLSINQIQFYFSSGAGKQKGRAQVIMNELRKRLSNLINNGSAPPNSTRQWRRSDSIMNKMIKKLNPIEEDGKFHFNSTTGGSTVTFLGPGLHFIPPVPPVSPNDLVDYIAESVTSNFTGLAPMEYREKIVILSPIHNVANSLDTFAKLLMSLTYPHHLISVVFGEDCSEDQTLETAYAVVKALKKSFHRAEVHHFNITGQVKGGWGNIHSLDQQRHRRQHLAKSRNLLLKAGLQDEKWVMWIDSDVSDITKDLIQQLLSADKDVVTASALFIDGYNRHKIWSSNGFGQTLVPNLRIYDKNSWRETARSLDSQKHLHKSELIVEGYSKTERIYLAHLKADGRVVKLDGVGGCALLIRASCHREGLIFPEEVYEHHLETEGLAKMAKHMGFGVYGMPFVEIFH